MNLRTRLKRYLNRKGVIRSSDSLIPYLKDLKHETLHVLDLGCLNDEVLFFPWRRLISVTGDLLLLRGLLGQGCLTEVWQRYQVDPVYFPQYVYDLWDVAILYDTLDQLAYVAAIDLLKEVEAKTKKLILLRTKLLTRPELVELGYNTEIHGDRIWAIKNLVASSSTEHIPPAKSIANTYPRNTYRITTGRFRHTR